MSLLAALLFVLFASCGVQAATIAEVGGGAERDGVQTMSADDSADIVLTNGVTTGDFIAVGGNAYDGGGAPASIGVSSNCGSFSVLSSAPVGVTRQFIAYMFAISTGACTVTINPAGGAAYIGAGAAKFTGVGALDVDDGATTGTGFTDTASITTVAANALILSTHTNGTQTTVTLPDGAVTEIAESDDNSCCTAYAFGFRIVTTPGAYDMTWGTADDVAWKMHTASFAPAGAATGARRRMVTP